MNVNPSLYEAFHVVELLVPNIIFFCSKSGTTNEIKTHDGAIQKIPQKNAELILQVCTMPVTNFPQNIMNIHVWNNYLRPNGFHYHSSLEMQNRSIQDFFFDYLQYYYSYLQL
jgi:hypothetical protein